MNLFLKNNFNIFKTKYIEINDRNANTIIEQEIPTIVYQTWAIKKLSKLHYLEFNKFREVNPDLTFLIYDDEMMDSYINTKWENHDICSIYNKSLFGPMKADIFRYCILYDNGGYYFDISKGCSTQITKLHNRNTKAFISFEKNDCVIPDNILLNEKIPFANKFVLQWGFGFAKNHPLLLNVINEICKYYPFFKNKIFENPKNAILTFTGPGMFTKCFREFAISETYTNCEIADIDFYNNGIFSLKGSITRYKIKPKYSKVKNSLIIT